MWLKQIISRNLQNHAEVVINLPQTGLVRFTGDNSNGKSVIVRTTRAILKNEITRPRKRASLINRTSMWAEIIYVRGDADIKLTVHLTREAAGTYIRYEENNCEPITRSLADKSYKDLIQRFGWHYDADTDISLNIAEVEDILLFFKTSYRTNGKVITTAMQDVDADNVLENFKELIKQARSVRDLNQQQTQAYMNALQALEIHDVEKLQEKKNKLQVLYNRLSGIYFPTLPEIRPVPKVRFSNISFPTLPRMRYPRIVSLEYGVLPDIVSLSNELQTLRSNKCPVCGRGFDCDC